MLKLPHSFCRLLKVTCERISHRTHVRKFTQLHWVGKSCSGESLESTLTIPSKYSGLQVRHLASRNKRLRIRIPPLSNDSIQPTPMSGSSQPNPNHISYGGQFEVTNNDGDVNDWNSQFDDSGPSQVTTCTVPTDFRIWENVRNCGHTTNESPPFKFRVVSYNVLAQYLLECHPYLYTDCWPKNLKWRVRAARLFDEIVSLDPDVLCLQEVQASHLTSFYSKFKEIGYYGIFKQKTGHRQDGCAIYFKTSLFEIEDDVSVEFHQPELPLLNRDNIGIMVKLVPKQAPRSPVVVATTHLLYNPKRTDVRLAQIRVLLAELDRFAYRGSQGRHIPIVLTGDLNSTPDSAVIHLLDKGYVRYNPQRDPSDWERIGVTDNCQHLSVYLNRQEGKDTEFTDLKIYNSEYSPSSPSPPGSPEGAGHGGMFNSGQVAHNLRLVSAYCQCKSGGQPEATTFQDYWVTVDYIYFSKCSSLKLVERLRLPTAQECEVLGCLPNDVYGSDHLVLAATFELRAPSEPKPFVDTPPARSATDQHQMKPLNKL